MLTNRELCKIICLRLIEDEKTNWYSYKLRNYINENYPQINIENVYPTIRKITKEEYIAGVEKLSDNNSLVMVFSLTQKGKDEILRYQKELKKLNEILLGDTYE